MPKKKNPVITLRESDIRRMKKEVTDDAVRSAFVIIFMVMHDKWGFGKKRLARLLKQTAELSEMIAEGDVSLAQLKRILKDEQGIEFE